MNFAEKLNAAVEKNKSLVCIGLDTNPELIPSGSNVLDFNKAIIDATADLVCAYKPNLAFYEAQGEQGWQNLYQTVKHIPAHIPVILDAKRNDIGNTAEAYAVAVFRQLGCDAVTINPYLGYDSVVPFLNYQDKGIIILCRTSNKGAADFQSLICEYEGDKIPLYQVIAAKAGRWNNNGNIGLVVGATYPDELKTIRKMQPLMPILIPGIGAQGGDLSLAVRNGIDANNRGVIINSSRQIIYASRGDDFPEAARRAADKLRTAINAEISRL